MQRRFYHEERKVAVSEVEQNIGGHGVYLVFEKVIDRPDFKILEDKILDFVRVKPGTDDNHVTVEGIEISVRKWPEIRSGLVIVQQLQALVTVLDDFVALIKCGYRHPLSIVRIGKHQSELNMTNQGIPVDRASVIYSGAVRVVSYKEGILIKALAARGSRSDNSIKQLTATPNTPSAKEINLSTEFGMESMGCEECAATTGPAAFFVYLLQTLNSIAVHTGNGNNTTLKDALFARRPDLETLELSCANIKVLIPYIDIEDPILQHERR
ncbi:hypothetical protein BDW59DRAFT_149263 [Aspergillus cavernicola]|uniref:Uncharacterized protein n=1 Tax=Aspergillus cavernicola TaxID=176166 RepID=A0ABR4I4X3_9EURO